MKRILYLLAAIFVMLPCIAGAQVMQDVFDRYSTDKGCTYVQLESRMMRMMRDRATEKGDTKLAELLAGIRSIQILVMNEGDAERFRLDADELLAPQFKPVSTIAEQGQTTCCYIRRSTLTDRSEFVLFTCGERETVLLDIYGHFDLNDVTRLASIRPQNRR